MVGVMGLLRSGEGLQHVRSLVPLSVTFLQQTLRRCWSAPEGLLLRQPWIYQRVLSFYCCYCVFLMNFAEQRLFWKVVPSLLSRAAFQKRLGAGREESAQVTTGDGLFEEITHPVPIRVKRK